MAPHQPAGRRSRRLARRLRARIRLAVRPLGRHEPAFGVLAAVVLGVLGGYGAIAFREAIRLVHHAAFGSDVSTLAPLAALPWWRRLLLPATGGLAVGLIVWRVAPEVRGSGVPEVMEAVARRGGAIRARVVAAKAAAAALTIGTGGSAGREGPIVHIGSALGSGLGQLLGLEPRRLRTFVACGSAAGIAATFNAPIAGALFAMEVILGDLTVVHLAPIVISSVVATVISRHHLGDFPAFSVPPYQLVTSRELLLYAALGAAAGALGAAFVRALDAATAAAERSPLPAWTRPAVGGLLVGAVGLVWPHVFGVGYETVNASLAGTLPAGVLLSAAGAKLVATAATLGSGGSGGVFAPSLFLGATLGGGWGQLAHAAFPDWTAGSGAYALVGMGAVVAATTHAPITAILVIFELTNDYRSIPPLMVACVVAVIVSAALHRESAYTAKLVRRGVRLREGRDVNLLRGVPVARAMDPAPPAVPAAAPLDEVVRRLLDAPQHELPVVDGGGRLVGTVGLGEVRAVLDQAQELGQVVVAADAADPSAPVLRPGDTLDLAMHLFGRCHRQLLPVCLGEPPDRLVGTLTRDAVIEAYNRQLLRADLAGGLAPLVGAAGGGRRIELPGGVVLAEVEAPLALAGRTLAQADLRRRLGVEVLLIHRAGGDGPGEVPAPGSRLAPGDRLLVLGTPEAVRRLEEGG